MDDDRTLFSFAVFAKEVVRIDNRLQFLFRKWLHETIIGETTKDISNLRETIRIPVPQEIDDQDEVMISEMSIIVRPVMWRDANGDKTMRTVIEMPQMDFIL